MTYKDDTIELHELAKAVPAELGPYWKYNTKRGRDCMGDLWPTAFLLSEGGVSVQLRYDSGRIVVSSGAEFHYRGADGRSQWTAPHDRKVAKGTSAADAHSIAKAVRRMLPKIEADCALADQCVGRARAYDQGKASLRERLIAAGCSTYGAEGVSLRNDAIDESIHRIDTSDDRVYFRDLALSPERAIAFVEWFKGLR